MEEGGSRGRWRTVQGKKHKTGGKGLRNRSVVRKGNLLGTSHGGTTGISYCKIYSSSDIA